MKRSRLFVTVPSAALAGALPAQAREAAAKSTEILTGLLDPVPEQAHRAVMRALDAAQRGRRAGMAEAAGVEPASGKGIGEDASGGPGGRRWRRRGA